MIQMKILEEFSFLEYNGALQGFFNFGLPEEN